LTWIEAAPIDPAELDLLKAQKHPAGFADKLMELLSTHPNMLKRIKQLASYRMG